MEDLKKILDMTEEELKAAGASMYTCTVSSSKVEEITAEQKEFTLFRTLFDSSLSITSYKDNKKGSASINSFDADAVKEAVLTSIQSSESGVPDKDYAVAPGIGEKAFADGPYEIDTEKMYMRMRELLDTIEKDYPQLIVFMMIGKHTACDSLFKTSSGSIISRKSGYYEFMLEMCAKEGDKVTSFEDATLSASGLDKPLIELSDFRTKIENTIKQLDMKPYEGKTLGTVVFTPGCLAQMLDTIGYNFLSDNAIISGTSPWKDKLGQKVADESITLSLTPVNKDIVNGERYTPDGFISENFNIIENGTLKSHFLTLYGANKSGGERSKNLSQCFNMAPGSKSLDEIISGISDGIIIGTYSGGEPGPAGDFSGIAKCSFLIKDGKNAGPVCEAMISGNLADMLNNVVGISSELLKNGDFILPYLACSGITIAGKSE